MNTKTSSNEFCYEKFNSDGTFNHHILTVHEERTPSLDAKKDGDHVHHRNNLEKKDKP